MNIADETLTDYSFLSRYHHTKSKNYLKRQYRIRHWIPMSIGTPCIKLGFILLFAETQVLNSLELFANKKQDEIAGKLWNVSFLLSWISILDLIFLMIHFPQNLNSARFKTHKLPNPSLNQNVNSLILENKPKQIPCLDLFLFSWDCPYDTWGPRDYSSSLL